MVQYCQRSLVVITITYSLTFLFCQIYSCQSKVLFSFVFLITFCQFFPLLSLHYTPSWVLVSVTTVFHFIQICTFDFQLVTPALLMSASLLLSHLFLGFPLVLAVYRLRQSNRVQYFERLLDGRFIICNDVNESA